MGERARRPVSLQRAAPGRAPVAEPSVPGWLRALLAAPLTLKLVGANLLVALAALAARTWTTSAATSTRTDTIILLGALAVALVANCVLVRLALHPVRVLDETASRVWRGDFAARVPASMVADRELRRLGRTLNLLLDGLETDRARMRELATQALRAQDDERARIARELHDSTAQTIAALGYQLSAAARDSRDAELTARLEEIREMTGTVLEEVRLLAHTIHPQVLDDLGLGPALEWLARTTRQHGGMDVVVDAADGVDADALPKAVTGALYRVAQESLRNAERHAAATRVTMHLARRGAALELDVDDDGRGFDLAEAEARRPGMGLFSMRERLGLVGGSLCIETAPGRGTRVRARVPTVPETSLALEQQR